MTKEVTLKLVEVEANKLKKDSKYIFLIEEASGIDNRTLDFINDELFRLLGENFMIIQVNDMNNFKVYSVEDK